MGKSFIHKVSYMLLSTADATSIAQIETELTSGAPLTSPIMPDIANERRAVVQGTLDAVGMQSVELPLVIKNDDGREMMIPCKANLYVNLSDPNTKGIHMSRLYRIAMEGFAAEPLTFASLSKMLSLYLESHDDISNEAKIEVQFELMTQRPSLKSGLKGWRSYPVHLNAETKGGKVHCDAEVQVMYSSTCPCSASLARQLIQNRFLESFTSETSIDKDVMLQWLGREDSICATPHSQRSIAHVKVKTAKLDFSPLDLIDQAEEVLSTPVQAMVKREDEQEFARLNGQNLMFCEDAARRLKATLTKLAYEDFRCEVQHFESLHPHDAVAIVVKGVEDGFRI
jgi:GTP cyclohydrolase I